MLASELARECQIDPSVMSKRLAVYRRLADAAQTGQHLDQQMVEHLRRVHQLLLEGHARNTEQAVNMALGLIDEPVPPRSAQLIMQRLEVLERQQAQMARLLEEMDGYLRPLVMPDNQE